ASEQTGWIGLYSVSAEGGDATRITPTGCEVFDVTLMRDRQSALYASNCGDIDHRHVQRVNVLGGAPVDITSGSGIEWRPQPVGDSGAVAVLRGDPRQPASPAMAGPPLTALQGWPLPDAFPASQLVEPTVSVVRAADSTEIHLV